MSSPTDESTSGPTDAPASGRPRFESAALLSELVANPLDAGYRAAARRRGPDARPRWYDRPLVAVGCLLIGFVAVVAWVHTNRGAPQAEKVHQDLVTRVRSAQHGADDLANRLAAEEQDVVRAQNAALPQSGTLARALRDDQIAAGQLAVHGPGLTVTLREPKTTDPSAPPARAGTVPIGATHILSDRDVRSVVNELWHDGAEAIAVNGVRLTPVSAIRFAGDAVLVDFQPISSPYRVQAIGDGDTLSTNFAQSPVASRYQTLVSVDHIGFSFGEHDRLDLPAGVPATVRTARVAPRPTSSKGRHK